MLVLVRHGESTANASGLLLGRAEVPLTPTGERQAAAIGSSLGAITRVISSPLGRAVQTARYLAGSRPVTIDDRWVEVDYGEYDGQPITAVPAEVWRRWRDDPDYCPPGGEPLSAVTRRVGQALEELFATGGGARDPAGDVVVVSHVSPIKAAVRWALGTAEPLDTRLHLGTGSVTRIGWGHGPVLEGFNHRP